MFRLFFIMPIGRADLDSIYTDLKTALESEFTDLDLVVVRVDLDNEGGLLKEEILDGLERSGLVVADLTYERPNCYLEVGYHMGFHRLVQGDRKWRRLILAARADHQPDLPERTPDQPKVHFDLGGYDLLYWEDGDDYRAQLVESVRRRIDLIAAGTPTALAGANDDVPSVPSAAPPLSAPAAKLVAHVQPSVPGLEDDWFNRQRGDALGPVEDRGFVELRARAEGLPTPHPIPRSDLLHAARACNRKGWPIAYVYSREGLRPKPVEKGIKATVPDRTGGLRGSETWALNDRGDFYDNRTLLEDMSETHGQQLDPGQNLLVNLRVFDHVALLMHVDRLYRSLGADDDAIVRFRIEHGGLRGRQISDSSDPVHAAMLRVKSPEPAEIPAVVCSGKVALGLLRDPTGLPRLVGDLCAPVFEVFDFAEVEGSRIEALVNQWLRSNG